MIWLLLVDAVILLSFGFVILFGAPYLPTKKKQVKTAFELLDLKKGQTLLELGCGDGRLLKEASKRGLVAVGYELNPLLYLTAKMVTKDCKNATVIFGNYWKKDWPKCQGIYVFLLDKYMDKLDKAIKTKVSKPVKLASFAFKIGSKKPHKEKNGVFLYLYK